MPRFVQYHKQTLETTNPIARYAHIRRYRKSIEITVKHLKTGDKIFDFGCGQGTFLNLISQRRGDVSLIGFDPYSAIDSMGEIFQIVTDLKAIRESSIDLVVAFEVLEHLTNPEMEEFAEISLFA